MDTATAYLSTIDKPRRRTNAQKYEIGESRSSESYGHNTDVDETVLGALVTQYMVSDHTPEAILITEQINSDGLVVHIEDHKVTDLKTVPVE